MCGSSCCTHYTSQTVRIIMAAAKVLLTLLLLTGLQASPCDDLDLADAAVLTCQCTPLMLQDENSTLLPCFSCTAAGNTENVYTELRLHHSVKEPWRTLEQSNYSRSLFCVKVEKLTLHRSQMRLTVEQIACTISYEAQLMFVVAQEAVEVTRPLHRYNAHKISVFLYFRKSLLPTIARNGNDVNYWEPSVPTHSRLTNLTVRRMASVPRFGPSQGRNATFDVFRQWPEAQLGDLSELRIENGDLFHVRADDIACMPQLTRLTISNCRTRHFSAQSLTSARENVLAMRRTPAYWHTNCQPEKNSSDVDRVLQKFDRCRSINTTQAYNQWVWQCHNSRAILKHLDLSDNLLTDFTIEVLAFQSLETVILSGNQLTAIPTFMKDLPNLESINLSRNEIHELYWSRRGYLKSLDLSFNQISSWNVYIFNSNTHHVRFVDLSHNEITLMSSEMMESLSSVSFDLTENPFDCDNCVAYEFQLWLLTHANIGGHVLCRTPHKWFKMPLKDINLMNCTHDKIYYQVAASVFGVPLGIVFLLSVVLAVRFRFQVNYVWHLVQMRRRAKHVHVTTDQQTRRGDLEYDAFVSYSGADRSWVHDVLVTSLESSERGYSLCLHERDFRLGAYIIDNVAQSMESSRHVILVLSPNFVASQWCQWEMKLVQQLMFEQQAEDFLVLVELERLPRNKLPSTLRLLMSTRTYLEWTGEQQLFVQRLCNALGQPLAHTRTHSDLSLRYSKNSDVSLRFSSKNTDVQLRYSTNTDVSLRYCSKISSGDPSLKYAEM